MLERFLINLDVGAPGAMLRMAFGFLLLPALQLLHPEPPAWALVAALLVTLFAVKVFAAVGRRAFPVTEVVRSHWEWRRNLARYHDSYQWRKLLWIGIGLIVRASLGVPGETVGWMLGVVCVVAGAAGEVFWRRQRLELAPPQTR